MFVVSFWQLLLVGVVLYVLLRRRPDHAQCGPRLWFWIPVGLVTYYLFRGYSPPGLGMSRGLALAGLAVLVLLVFGRHRRGALASLAIAAAVMGGFWVLAVDRAPAVESPESVGRQVDEFVEHRFEPRWERFWERFPHPFHHGQFPPGRPSEGPPPPATSFEMRLRPEDIARHDVTSTELAAALWHLVRLVDDASVPAQVELRDLENIVVAERDQHQVRLGELVRLSRRTLRHGLHDEHDFSIVLSSPASSAAGIPQVNAEEIAVEVEQRQLSWPLAERPLVGSPPGRQPLELRVVARNLPAWRAAGHAPAVVTLEAAPQTATLPPVAETAAATEPPSAVEQVTATAETIAAQAEAAAATATAAGEAAAEVAEAASQAANELAEAASSAADAVAQAAETAAAEIASATAAEGATPPSVPVAAEASAPEATPATPALPAVPVAAAPPAAPVAPAPPTNALVAGEEAAPAAGTRMNVRRAPPRWRSGWRGEASAPPTLEVPAPRRLTERPAWIDQPPARRGGEYMLNGTAGPYSTVAECEAEMPRLVGQLVAQYEARLFPDAPHPSHLRYDDWEALGIVREYYIAEVDSPSLGKMYQLHVLTGFDNRARAAIDRLMYQLVAWHRAVNVGVAAGLMCAVLATALGYLKLDTATRGYYSGRLQLAAAALLATLTTLAILVWTGVLL